MNITAIKKFIGADCRRVRRADGRTQADLAFELDTQQENISRFERGNMGLEALVGYSKAYGVNPGRLLNKAIKQS
jgi:transcriptional regulator with XRE-family HTH domain